MIFVLQGYGITIDVVSTTFISKAGITSATLKTVPDQPFSSFELTFPEGSSRHWERTRISANPHTRSRRRKP